MQMDQTTVSGQCRWTKQLLVDNADGPNNCWWTMQTDQMTITRRLADDADGLKQLFAGSIPSSSYATALLLISGLTVVPAAVLRAVVC